MKYLNAVNILATAKIDALQIIHDAFRGDWERAWHSDLAGYLPREKDIDGKLNKIDYRKLQRSINADLAWKKVTEEGVKLITILDDDYPVQLRHIPHPPFLLYVKGSAEVWRENGFAVVGTRALSEYGKRSAPRIVSQVARAGFTIVSGLAMGIDTLAHKAALQEKAKTIAVLGSGIDDKTLFPPQNLGLAREIINTGGAVIGEYALGTHGSLFTFPQRNRIISGLAKGVLVVEADIKSGAMITARCALEQNRDVFAVPGSIFAKTSEGTNNIIKKGAKLVTCAEDILEEYEIYLDKKEREIKPDNPIEEKILTVLISETMTADDIIRKTGIEANQIAAALTIMELNGKIKNFGSKFALNK